MKNFAPIISLLLAFALSAGPVQATPRSCAKLVYLLDLGELPLELRRIPLRQRLLTPLFKRAAQGFFRPAKRRIKRNYEASMKKLNSYAHEEVWIPTQTPHVSLHGWIYRQENASQRPTMVVVHEVQGGKTYKFDFAKLLLDEGYNVVLVDIRNHGFSKKDRANSDWANRLADDIISTFDFVGQHEQLSATPKGLLAFSITDFAGLKALDVIHQDVQVAVFDSGPGRDAYQIFGNFHDQYIEKKLPALGLLKKLGLLQFVREGFMQKSVQLIGKGWPPGPLPHVDTKILVIATQGDQVIPPGQIQALFDRVSVPHYKIHLLENSEKTGHLEGFTRHQAEYVDVLLDHLRNSF